MNHAEPNNRWERHKERTRRHLLQAADHLFREKGFDTTTVEEIAHAAGVAKGTLFNYFETKETLLLNLLALRIEETLTTLPGEGQAAPTRIRLTLKAAWDALSPYRHLTRHAVLHNVRPPQRPSTKPQRMKHALIELIQQGQEEGSIRADVDAEAAALFLSIYFLRLCFTDGTEPTSDSSWEDHLEQGLTILYHGLLTRA
jgi:AcrR family transcriptional regulator